MRKATGYRPAGRAVAGCFQAAPRDVRGFLGSVVDLEGDQPESEELDTENAERKEKRHHHGELGSCLPARCPSHDPSILQADCRFRYTSSRSMPCSVTLRSSSGRAAARSFTPKAAVMRFATLSAAAAVAA